MGMVLHTMSYNIRDLVELPIVHLKERMEYPPLDGFQAVSDIGYCPILYHIGRIFEKVLFE